MPADKEGPSWAVALMASRVAASHAIVHHDLDTSHVSADVLNEGAEHADETLDDVYLKVRTNPNSYL